MSPALFVVIAVAAALVTPLTVLLIPRARQSPAFDRILWLGTWLLAFCGAWLAFAYAASSSGSSAWNSLVVAGVPVLPPVVGAVAGALFINLSLWVVDRFVGPS